MALTFPVALVDFFDGIPVQVATPDLGEAVEMSETGGGELITADVGVRLWRMDVSLRPGTYAEIERIKAKLQTLRYAGRSLMVHSIPMIAPSYDPNGAILGANVVQVANATSREISISGLPAGYQLKAGEFLSFPYGTSPVRYALHQIVEDKTASGGGVITNMEVVPHVRAGWVAGDIVRLIKPQFKAVVMPGSTSMPSISQQLSTGLKFSVQQTLR
jgi:hypothetical protein